MGLFSSLVKASLKTAQIQTVNRVARVLPSKALKAVVGDKMYNSLTEKPYDAPKKVGSPISAVQAAVVGKVQEARMKSFEKKMGKMSYAELEAEFGKVSYMEQANTQQMSQRSKVDLNPTKGMTKAEAAQFYRDIAQKRLEAEFGGDLNLYMNSRQGNREFFKDVLREHKAYSVMGINDFETVSTPVEAAKRRQLDTISTFNDIKMEDAALAAIASRPSDVDFDTDIAPVIDVAKLDSFGYTLKTIIEPSDEIMDLAQRIVQGIEGDPNVNQLSVETIADELAQLDERAIQDFYRDNQELAEGYYHLGVNDFNPTVEETVALIRQYA